MSALVQLELAMIKYCKLGGLDNKHLFLTDLEAGKSKVLVLADLVSGMGPLPGLQKVEMEGGLGSSPSPEDTEKTSCKPNYLSKAPSPNTITLGIRILIYQFVGIKTILSLAISIHLQDSFNITSQGIIGDLDHGLIWGQ